MPLFASNIRHALLLVAALSLVLAGCGHNPFLSEASTFGPPLRAGDRVYLLTGQWKSTMRSSVRSNRNSELLVDIWAFDANTAKPLWRKRVDQERGGAMYGHSILGADGDTLWLFGPSGLVAVSLTDGRVLANSRTLEETHPELRGLLPREARYFNFDDNGLHITTADGRTRDFSLETGKPGQRIRPAFHTPMASHLFQARGLTIPGQWLGLLTDDEATKFSVNQIGNDLWGEFRRRLWVARATEGDTSYGTRYTDFKPLGTTDYLVGGLLAEFIQGAPKRVLWYRNPDSVLVLHRDRLGEEGRLKLARVAGPEGKVLWDQSLPLSHLQSLMPGEKSLALYGVEYTRRKENDRSDPMHSAHEMLVVIDLATGNKRVHDQSNTDEHIEAR